MLTPPPAMDSKVPERVDINVNSGVVVGHYNPMRDHNISGLTRSGVPPQTSQEGISMD